MSGAMTIDELARAAGTTSRNIRAYQTRGLLPGPDLVGRTGYYDAAHLTRLRLIANLQSRGFALESIKQLLEAWEQGSSLSDVLGFTEALEAPWIEESPQRITREELLQWFPDVGVDPMLLARAAELELVVPEGERFLIPTPALLHVGAALVEAGIPLAAVLEEAARLRVNARDMAERFVALFRSHVWEPFVTGATPGRELSDITDLLQRLRPVASRAVQLFFARAMERTVEEAMTRDREALLRAIGNGTSSGASG